MSVSTEYVTGYLNALTVHYAMTSKDRAAKVAAVRAGLIALAASSDTIAKKVAATGVSKSKVSRDNITGKWLIANPKADAVQVKLCGDQLDKAQMTSAKSLKDLQALMPAAAKAKKAAKKAPAKKAPAPKVTVTTPDSRITAANSQNLGVLKDLEAGLPIDPQLYKAYIATISAIALRHNAPKVQKVA